MSYVDSAIAFGLLLMGMGIGAFLTREFYRRNLQAILEQEIEKSCSCSRYRSDPASGELSQPMAHLALKLQGGHSPGQAN